MNQNEAIAYRHRLQQRSGFRRTWLTYAGLVLLPPALLSLARHLPSQRYGDSMDWFPFYLGVFLHLFFFCSRGLYSNLSRIARERERRTFEVLLTTRLTKRDIVAGLLKTSTLPELPSIAILSLALFFVHPELGWAGCLGLMALTSVLWLSFSMVGLALSLRAGSALAATSLGATYLCWSFVISFITDVLLWQDLRGDPLFLSCLFNPMVMAQSLINESSGTGWDALGPVQIAIFQIALASACLLYFWWRVDRPLQQRAGQKSSQLSPFRRWIGDPILYREFQVGRYLLIYPALWAAPFLYCLSGGLGEDLGNAFALAACLHLLYYGYRATSRSITTFSSEKERRTLDSLLGTRLSRGELSRGKLKAVFYPILAELLLFSPLFLMGLLASEIELYKGLVILLMTLADVGLFGMLGIWLSAKLLDSHKAGQRITALFAALYFATPMADIVLSIVTHGRDIFVASVGSPLMSTLILLWEPKHAHVWIFHLVIFLPLALVLLNRFPKLVDRVLQS